MASCGCRMLQFKEEAAMPDSSTTAGLPLPMCTTCIGPRSVLSISPCGGNLRASKRANTCCNNICNSSTHKMIAASNTFSKASEKEHIYCQAAEQQLPIY